MKKFLSGSLAALLTIGLLAGCGSKPAEQPKPATQQPAAAQPAGEVSVKVATISPLSGGQASLGTAIKNGAEMALKDYADKLKAAKVKVELAPQDDKADPPTGSQIAEKVLNDKSIVAVVGTLNSGVAKGVAPVLLRDNVIMVSPANTGVILTTSGWKNFTRIVFRDDYQGPAGARYAVKTLGAKAIAVLHDKTEYGQGMADEFVKEAVKLGAKILNGGGKGEGIDPKATDWSATLTPIIAQNPDVLYYGGIYDTAGPLFKQAREKGYKGKFMGGDGLDSGDLVKLGGDAVDGTYFTSIDADYKSGEGKKFFDAYKAAYNADPPAYAAYGYDAMRIVLEGIIKVAGSGKANNRAAVMEAVKATKGFKGLGGPVSFDANGDNPESTVFIFQIKEKKYPGVSLGPAPK